MQNSTMPPQDPPSETWHESNFDDEQNCQSGPADYDGDSTTRVRYGNNKAHRPVWKRKVQAKIAKASKKRNRK
jgi:hypothetical protein